MRIRLGSGLLIANFASLILIIIILFLPDHNLRLFLGIPFLLFIPGYALTAAIFIQNWRLRRLERIALSVGLSVIIVSLIGLILNFTPLGIGLEPVLYSVSSFILMASLIAWQRRRKINEFERFTINFRIAMPNWGSNPWNNLLNVIIIITLLGIFGTIGYLIAKPKIGEEFTEFYILGPEGEASDYPKEMNIGDEGRVVLGIINHEGKETTYTVEIKISNSSNSHIGPISLVDGEKWEKEALFVPTEIGGSQKVEFLLYVVGSPEPYLEPIYLWIDVV